MKLAILFFILLLAPVIRESLESVMVLHMFLQLPLLILVGVLLHGNRNWRFLEKWNDNGVAGMLLAVGVLIFWMLPRSLDDALTEIELEIWKFASLPLLGFLWKNSWRKIGGIFKSFLYINFLSMFGLLAWLYLGTPVQICNNYLINEQHIVGAVYLSSVLVLLLNLLYIVFFRGLGEEAE
ncbi:hypothetical protein [Gracilibacillus suaedae]|uniref:hypothetical protein n=1 Tax=Gracilibacillus suaedae TaxID=2820273 RepID=UPI001ABE2B3F|nr:hypothetical protein [Gracilibacillus suaedae]